MFSSLSETSLVGLSFYFFQLFMKQQNLRLFEIEAILSGTNEHDIKIEFLF